MSALAIDSVGLLRGPRPAAAALGEGRAALLRSLGQPSSASDLARRLGQPRQRINYHLRELEKAGLVRLVEERRKGNCLERVVVATARSYLISPEALGALGPDPESVPDRASSAYLVASAGEAIREVAVLRERAANAGKKLATMTLRTSVRFDSAESMNAFAEELTDAVTRLAAKYHRDAPAGTECDPVSTGRLFKLMVASYPAVTKPEEPQP